MTRDDCPGQARAPDLAELFREHANGLAGVVRGILGDRSEAQEVLQDAFLRAWKAEGSGARPGNDVAWIFVITMNLAKDQRRKDMRRGPRQSLEEVNPMELRSVEPAPETRLEQAEAVAAARDAIHALQTNEKDVFLLRTSAGLSFTEAAAALGIPVGTAKTRMRAALIHLRDKLKHFAPAQYVDELQQETQSRQEGSQKRRAR